MATGGSPDDDLMEIVRSFFSGEMDQQWTVQEQIALDEAGPSTNSLMNIPSEEFIVLGASLLQPDLNREEAIQDHLRDQNTLSSIPSVPAPHCSNKPYVVIIEQPAPYSVRFRYKSETVGRPAGNILGVHNTTEVKTYPTIKVMNYQGTYIVIVSCVTKDGPPFWPHPHELIGREGCKRGVCSLVVNNPDMTCSFKNLGIQCVKKREIEESLRVREQHNLDPFKTGFNHPGSIDLTVIRLCFHVFIPRGSNCPPKSLPPVVSDPIYDKKALSDLSIMKLSHCSAPASGGTEVILLCDRVTKEDIQIWFYEEQGTRVVWESQAEFHPSDVHKQVAISFRTPPYHNENIQQPVPVLLELRKPSENKRGRPRQFYFWPVVRDPERIAHKKRKFIEESINLERYFQGGPIPQGHQLSTSVPRTIRQSFHQSTKAEPLVGPNANKDHIAQPSTSFADNSHSTILTTMPTSIEGPSTSSHLTPVHLPELATTPGAHSHASITPPLPVIPSHIMQQMMQRTERPEQSNINETRVAEEDDIVEKFDSLGLNNDQNLSASMFDSAPNITDSTYQHNPSAADEQK